MKKKRTFTHQEKADIVLEILREDETLTEIFKKYDIAQPVLSRWKSEFLDGMPRVFNKKGADLAKLKAEHEKEKSELLEKIGSLTIDVDWLKKKTTPTLGNEEKRALIDFNPKEISVTKQCELLDIPRSSAYHKAKPKVITQLEIDIKNAIDIIHYKEPSYGKRRMVIELEKLGFKVGRKLVKTYMDEMGIHAFYPGPNLSKKAKQNAIYPYRLRNLKLVSSRLHGRATNL